MKERLATFRGRATWRGGVVALVAVAFLGAAGERGLAWQDQRQHLEDERAAAAAASTEIEGLIDLSSAGLDKDVKKLLDGATADFRSELEAQAESLSQAVTKNEVTASGDVVSTGVVTLANGRATVIVAAAGTVKNKQSAEAEPRNYRLRVDLQYDGDRWLVSGLEFVA